MTFLLSFRPLGLASRVSGGVNVDAMEVNAEDQQTVCAGRRFAPIWLNGEVGFCNESNLWSFFFFCFFFFSVFKKNRKKGA